MRRLAALLLVVLALGTSGGARPALANSAAQTDLPNVSWPPILEPLDDLIVWPPWIDLWILDRLEKLVDALWPPAINPPQPVDPCAALAVTFQAAYVDCHTQAEETSDPRTGTSYTTSASASACRREASGDECVSATQGVSRTGAEAGPTVRQEENTLPVPQACVGSTCTPSAAMTAPTKVTVFDSGTAPEVSVYAPTGAVHANAPQACVSLDNTCTAGSTATGTDSAAVENVKASQILSTN